MNTTLVNFVRNLSFKLGYEIIPFRNLLSPDVSEIAKATRPYTMTSVLRIHALCESVRYLIYNKIEGDIVECGVWRGGSMMAVAFMLSKLQSESKELWLYDTYEGMPEPTALDIEASSGVAAAESLESEGKTKDSLYWAYASLDDVSSNLQLTNYPQGKLHFIKGKVENTIPQNIPDKIALLRLDTDWYESTKHCMENLFPRLTQGGVLILDDYGFWLGARKAVDEYFASQSINPLLIPVDGTGRVMIKQ